MAWVNETKSVGGTSGVVERNLLIEGTFKLLISDGYVLNIEGGSKEWNTQPKNATPSWTQESKNVSSWTNESKNATPSWAQDSKNSASWTNTNKS